MSGVGTELKKIIPRFFESKKCNCGNAAARYDRWGIERCERLEDAIVEDLVVKSRRLASTKKIPEVFTKAVARYWVRMAISRAKKNAKR